LGLSLFGFRSFPHRVILHCPGTPTVIPHRTHTHTHTHTQIHTNTAFRL
jgi:hypothetical protein